MAKITLRIEADASAVSTAFANLKKEVQALGQTKINLGIDEKIASEKIKKVGDAADQLQKRFAKIGSADSIALMGTKLDNVRLKMERLNTVTADMQKHFQTLQTALKILENPAASIQDRTAAYEKFNSTLRVLRGEITNATQAERNEAAAARDAGEATREAGGAASDASGKFDALSVALGNIASRAFHLVLSKITQGLRDALAEMKDVDTQLTNISKVSGITGQSLADMGERAYETASKYGVSADEYLSAVYTFQKAGLGPSAEAMGELAVKTMLVGDTTADVASKFLISANAAWQMGGDINRLNQIVDEADFINNNYATDLGKLSEGLPRVASVAAQAGMSAEETLAAIGTITAVTQESGTKSATALRALILNIEGQIGEFVDDTGETFEVTEESVKSMQGLMEKYAKAELDAAKASGELINPMSAIKAIFEGMANEDLNDQELFALLSGMGGKLRTNQLTALVQNYEMFDEMLKKIADSAGTADSEIALMMESWEKKTQVLKNTWTEFIADIVDTGTVKGFIEDLTYFVEALDRLVEKSTNPWFGSEETSGEIDATKKKIEELTSAIDDLNGATDHESELKLHDLDVELGIQKEILETKQKQYELEKKQETEKLQNELTRSYLDPDGTWKRVDIEEMEALSRRIADIDFTGNIGEFQESLKNVISDFDDYYQRVMEVKNAGGKLTAEQEAFIKQYEAADKLTQSQNLHIGELVDNYWQIVDSQGRVVASLRDITDEQNQQQAQLDEQLNEQETFWDKINDGVQAYEASVGGAGQSAEELGNQEESAADNADDIASAAEGISFAAAIAGALRLAAALGQAEANAANISVGGVGGGGGLASGTTNAPGGPTLVNELGPELISENGKAYIANGGKPGVVNLSKGAIVLTAKETKDALRGNGITKAIHAAAKGRKAARNGPSPHSTTPRDPGGGGGNGGDGGNGGGGNNGGNNGGGNNQIDPIETKPGPPEKHTPIKTTPPGGGGGGGGGGGQKKSKKDKAKEAAEKLEEKLTNLDKQATLANNEKRYKDEQKIYRKAIKLINKQIETYKKAGFKDTSNEVLDLKNKIHDYEKKIETSKKSAKDEAEKGDKEAEKKLSDQLSNIDKQATLAKTEKRYGDEKKLYRRAISLIKKQLAAYKKSGYKDTSDAVVDLKNKIHDYENKISSVDKAQWDEAIAARQAEIDARRKAQEQQEKEDAVAAAQTALANAKNQRTVRMFNAQTGQWEWIADQAAIDQAQKQLDDANEAIVRAKEDEELENLRKQRDAGKTYGTTAKNKVGSKVKAVSSAVAANAGALGASFLNGMGGTTGGGTTAADTSTTTGGNTSVDSHNIIYNFGNISMGQSEAESTSVAELAKRLSVLNIS